MIAWVLGTRVGRALTGALALVLSVVTFGVLQRRKGHKEGAEGVRRRATAAGETRKEERNEIDDDVRGSDAVSELRNDWGRD